MVYLTFAVIEKFISTTKEGFAQVPTELRFEAFYIFQDRGREPMTREPDVAFLMAASGSLDIFLTRLLRMKLFL